MLVPHSTLCATQEKVEFLREDLKHLFDGKGIDARFVCVLTRFYSVYTYLKYMRMGTTV